MTNQIIECDVCKIRLDDILHYELKGVSVQHFCNIKCLRQWVNNPVWTKSMLESAKQRGKELFDLHSDEAKQVGFANVTIHTPSGDVIYSHGIAISDTTHPEAVFIDQRYPDGRPVNPHDREMPTMPGGVSVDLDLPGQPPIAVERRTLEVPEGPPHEAGK